VLRFGFRKRGVACRIMVDASLQERQQESLEIIKTFNKESERRNSELRGGVKFDKLSFWT